MVYRPGDDTMEVESIQIGISKLYIRLGEYISNKYILHIYKKNKLENNTFDNLKDFKVYLLN